MKYNQIYIIVLVLFGLQASGQDTARMAADTLLATPDTLAVARDSARKTDSRVMEGTASWYSNSFEGRRTASGEIFSQKKYTAACNVLPLGTWVRLTNLRNKKTVIVKINDRMHPRMKRLVDLSRAAAAKLDFLSRGLTRVRLEVLGKKRPPGAD